ncbi:hypothetical protein GW17_00028700 [Ensete ventricosum]|nr:hypothetical protein GW17_00028700 [Ensete ventricosum]
MDRARESGKSNALGTGFSLFFFSHFFFFPQSNVDSRNRPPTIDFNGTAWWYIPVCWYARIIPCNEAAPYPNEGRRGDASSSNGRMRRRLVFQRVNEASPHHIVGRQDTTSYQHRKTRCRLAFQQKNEAAPHPNEER